MAWLFSYLFFIAGDVALLFIVVYNAFKVKISRIIKSTPSRTGFPFFRHGGSSICSNRSLGMQSNALDKDWKEIDLLIVQDGTIHPLEFKKNRFAG